jgi:hypothetical protein
VDAFLSFLSAPLGVALPSGSDIEAIARAIAGTCVVADRGAAAAVLEDLVRAHGTWREAPEHVRGAASRPAADVARGRRLLDECARWRDWGGWELVASAYAAAAELVGTAVWRRLIAPELAWSRTRPAVASSPEEWADRVAYVLETVEDVSDGYE